MKGSGKMFAIKVGLKNTTTGETRDIVVPAPAVMLLADGMPTPIVAMLWAQVDPDTCPLDSAEVALAALSAAAKHIAELAEDASLN